VELILDIGNTNVVGAVFDGERRLATFRLQSNSSRTEDEYGLEVISVLAAKGVNARLIKRVVLGSVVPPLTSVFSLCCRAYFTCPVIIVTAESEHGVTLRCDFPGSVGVDRIANTVGACSIQTPPLIVVDFGTATTFDVVAADGAYEGGAISPGLVIASDALSSRAALLQRTTLEKPARAIGKNTRDSMLSGIVLGYAGLTEGLIGRFRQELGADVPVIGTGGLAPLVASATTVIDRIVPELTLLGLRILGERLSRLTN
jgi:type III pantothenate kinase